MTVPLRGLKSRRFVVTGVMTDNQRKNLENRIKSLEQKIKERKIIIRQFEEQQERNINAFEKQIDDLESKLD